MVSSYGMLSVKMAYLDYNKTADESSTNNNSNI